MEPSCLLGLANSHLLFESCAEGLEIRFEEPDVAAHHAEMGNLLSLYSGAARSARVGVRLSSEEQHQVDAAAKTRGYANPSAFIRAAIRNELKGRPELTGTEERIAGGFNGISRDIFRVERGQHALFALVDAFAKVVLTCVAEPPPDARPQATARARERYDRLMKAAGQAMSGNARAVIEDLVSHGTN